MKSIWMTVLGLLVTGLSSLPSSATAQGPDPVPLWGEIAPGAKGNDPADIPEIRIYPAADAIATGAMVVVLPGGGYGALATDHEGHQIANWFNSIGVSAAVVKYRLGPKYNHPYPLLDAQRAVRYVRAHAEELKTDPNRIGIMGFSAGGHLASTVSTWFDAGDPDNEDVVARQSSRPDFSILCYPVISLKSSFAHGGSRKNLLGENQDPALLEKLSTETQVTAETPPTFIFHTSEDTAVPVKNALVYYEALQNHGVPAELHVYQRGPHGVGLATHDPVLSTWTGRLKDWLQNNGFLTASKRVSAKGTVKLNGTPLRWGTITFIPNDQLTAPTAFGMIGGGHFSFSDVNGPISGANRVVICNLGSVEPHPTVIGEELLNTSALVLNVQNSPNEFSLELQSSKE